MAKQKLCQNVGIVFGKARPIPYQISQVLGQELRCALPRPDEILRLKAKPKSTDQILAALSTLSALATPAHQPKILLPSALCPLPSTLYPLPSTLYPLPSPPKILHTTITSPLRTLHIAHLTLRLTLHQPEPPDTSAQKACYTPVSLQKSPSHEQTQLRP